MITRSLLSSSPPSYHSNVIIIIYQVRGIWGGILKSSVENETDFFAAGAGSMDVVRLIEEVKLYCCIRFCICVCVLYWYLNLYLYLLDPWMLFASLIIKLMTVMMIKVVIILIINMIMMRIFMVMIIIINMMIIMKIMIR